MQDSTDKIGMFRTPYSKSTDPWRKPSYHDEVESVIDVFPNFKEKLHKLEGATHIFVVYQDQGTEGKPSIKKHSACPPESDRKICQSVLRLKGILGSLLIINGIEVINETPVLDIRPLYAEPRFCFKNGPM